MVKSSNQRLFAYAVLIAFVLQVLPDVNLFAAPPAPKHLQSTGTAVELGSASPFVTGFAADAVASTRTARSAAAAGVSLGTKVIHAMGAGAVASVIQAALSAVGEPIINRVLVKRMKVMEAIKDVKPSMMLSFFKTTLITNFLKFPFFEGINALCAHLPISAHVRGFITGLVFTSATLPVTNYRYRKSMQLPVNWANIYEAYPPTVIRDIFYGIVRNWCTIGCLAINPSWKATSPTVLFIVVILACIGSAPFNEWRGYLLQSKGQELTFKEFFKPSNFIRSTSLGAFKQGLSLAVGYWCAPPVQKFVSDFFAGLKH
jgi:hypothetical protein